MKYKKDPREYPDWEIYNEPLGRKQPGRKHSDVLVCENPSCPSGGHVSEHEAFYTFAKQSIFIRMFSGGNLYICPFCKGTKLRSDLMTDSPEWKAALRRYGIK